jgi:lipopolysaccharide/colanic/teichoic acid biosynthesis glycosyltransferase
VASVSEETRSRRRLLTERSILSRKRFQFVGALLVAALLPYLVRALGPPTLTGPATINALVANCVAVIIAFWLRLSVETYPGTRRNAVILPSSLAGHGVVVAWFLFTRLPYDRVALIAGVLLHITWLYVLYIGAERRLRTRIAVVPFGDVERLTSIRGVEWVRLSRPELRNAAGCEAIVADFSADLPDEWEAFLADAALAGRIVYQHKQLSESLTGRVELQHLSENSFGSLVPSRAYFHIKGLTDFFFALFWLPLALPVMVVIAFAILLDDGRPVVFRQKRLGQAGRSITVYKFRTMRSVDLGESEHEVRNALATDEADPRITRVGKILRKLRLDELPQILNILKWEMSWIGPRPEPELLTHWFIAEIPFYRYRHVVKPGISGWAQVNQGYVSGVDGINVKLQYDFYYIKYFSPWLDLLVFLRTIKTMVTGFGSK